MVDYAFVRKHIESMYEFICTIIGYKKNKENGETILEEQVLYENIPCRLSTRWQNPSNQSRSTNDIDEVFELFIAPEVKIPHGSKLFISGFGLTKEYEQSGEPFVWPSHQQIMLRLVKK